MADPKVDKLRRVPIFSQCSSRELGFLSSRMDEVSIRAGRTLINEGAPGNTFYLILAGEVEVSVKGRLRRLLGSGDFFGEISMLDRGPATATVVAKTAVQALVMSHAQFKDAIRGNEAITMKVIATMADRLRADSLA